MPDRRRGGLLTFVRFQGWRIVLPVLLVGLGLLNVYPFFWMIGTSLKAVGEAGHERHRPIPRLKYYLTEKAETPLPGGLVMPQLRLLVSLERRLRADGAPPAISAGDYAERYYVAPEDAPAHLRQLAEMGLLVQDAPGRWTMVQAPISVADGLNARQLLRIAALAAENADRPGKQFVVMPDSVSAGDHARDCGIDEGQATADLEGLVARGYMVARRAQLRNYVELLGDPTIRFWLPLINSLVLTASVVTLTIMLTTMLGYALARLHFPGKMLVLGLLLAGTVAPNEAIIIPVFRMLHSLGLLDGMGGMILWMSGVGIGNTFLTAGFFLTLPKEVEEAATIDGAGTFRTFFDVALPMARPIVMTVCLFAFLGSWNEFMRPLVCTMSRPQMQPLAVAVYTFQKGYPGAWQLFNAAAAVMIVPVIVLFIFLQRHVVRSIAVGAVKG